MRWEDTGLLIEGVEVVEIDNDSLAAHLQALYELTDKYDQIDLHRWSGDVPKADVLAVAEGGIYDVGRRTAEMIEKVFAEWLRFHAITEPRMWAEARDQEAEEYREPSEAVEGAVAEYITNSIARDYGAGAYNQELRKQYRAQFFQDMEASINELPSLQKALKPYLDDIHNMRIEDYESGELEEEPEYPEPYEAFEWFSTDPGSWSHVPTNTMKQVVIELYEKIVFPVWYGRWQAEGIDETRERVEDVHHKLERIVNDTKLIPARKLATELNLIINTMHQTGSMLDYVENQYPQVHESLLDELSDWNFPEADEELKEMGVRPELQGDAIVRRRVRAEAGQIVRDAWRRLAEYERAGNPRQTLQEAVISELENDH